MTLFNTPSQTSSDGHETEDFLTPHFVVGSIMGAPSPLVTPSPLAVWRALGLEPMSNTRFPSGDKEGCHQGLSQCTCEHRPCQIQNPWTQLNGVSLQTRMSAALMPVKHAKLGKREQS